MANEDTLQRVRDATESTDTTATNIDSAQGNWAGIETGQETVEVAGTAEALNGGTSLAVPDGASVRLKALGGNSGDVYVGDNTVSAGTGYVLDVGEMISVATTDVSNIFVDVDTAGEGVSWIVEVDA